MNRTALAATALTCLASQAAGAETLADAVRAALASNPTLAAARARQEGLAERPEQARAAGRLTADAETTGGYDRLDIGRGGSAALTASLPVWTGGRVSSAVRAASGEVAAGEEAVRDVAAGVLADAVTAYAGVLLQQQALSIARADIELLDAQVAEARARFDLGIGTQTDVVRLVAQRESAAATQAANEAASSAAAASYRAIVGHDPAALAPAPADLGLLPRTQDEARRLGLTANPVYRKAIAARRAAGARIDVARTNGAPSLNVGGSYGYGLALGRDPAGYLRAGAVAVTLRLPFLSGGLVASQVRQAEADDRAAGYDVDAAGREAARASDTAWASTAAARLRVEAGGRAVAAGERALAGVKAEYAVGLRTTLDILIADESLRAAQLSLAGARADLLISEAALLRAAGSLVEEAFD